MSRIDKVNQSVKKEVSLIIQRELQDPRLQFVSITKADVSKDLQHAKVYFSVLGSQEQMMKAQEGLQKTAGLVRRFLAQRLKMRYVPEIEFLFDKSIEYSTRIDQALEEIRHEREENH